MDILSVEPHIDITIDENEVIKGATEIIKTIRPTWPIDQLLFKVNFIYKCDNLSYLLLSESVYLIVRG